MRSLEKVIGYRFSNSAWLREALCHKSYASEGKSEVHNERLEFLGDSILAAIVAHELFVQHPGENEGYLSKKKAQLVSRQNLAQWAAQLDLGSHLSLGVGEESTGGRTRQSVLGNALEALIGAIYMDGGYSAAQQFVTQGLTKYCQWEETDFKSRLQEIAQKKYKTTPHYQWVNSAGPEHDKTFGVVVSVGKKTLGQGEGKSKKEAEQAAAKMALGKLQKA